MIAIDLGSNTIRFIEFDGINWGKSFEKIVRAAESIHDTGKIGDRALNRIIDAIAEANEHLDFTHNEVSAVATAALRMAQNQDQILKDIKSHTGISFNVIDGDEEAKLTLKAVRYRLEKLGFANDPFVLLDIGGGSTECIVVNQDQVDIQSFNTGIVTMSERYESIDEIKANLTRFGQEIESFVRSKIKDPFLLIFTAGTPTTIAAYLNGMDYSTYDPEMINGYRLSLSGCRRAYEELMGMNDETRQRYVGVGRENLIATGILIVQEIFAVLGKEESVIIDDGLREGVALEYFCEYKTPHLT